MKNKSTQNKINLIHSKEFISVLQFEANYGLAYKGGSLPIEFNDIKTKRLVSNINLLTTNEKENLIYSIYNSNN